MVANMQRDIIVQKLRDRGCRITKQRLMLLDIILEEDCTSCKEIFYKASRRDKDIGTATVYRMVNMLEEIGAISRRNMYRIACGEKCDVERACRIELENGSEIELPAGDWHEVIRAGLVKCGYIKRGEKIKSVVAMPCACTE